MFSMIFSAVRFLIWIALIVAFVAFLKGSRLDLHRSRRNKKLCGVCGGIGEALKVDPTIVRLIWILVSVYFGCGLLAYFLAVLIMPEGY